MMHLRREDLIFDEIIWYLNSVGYMKIPAVPLTETAGIMFQCDFICRMVNDRLSGRDCFEAIPFICFIAADIVGAIIDRPSVSALILQKQMNMIGHNAGMVHRNSRTMYGDIRNVLKDDHAKDV